MICCRRS